MYPLKQSTSITVPIYVHDTAGEPVTGLLDAGWTNKRISKNGGAFGAMTVTITEMEFGFYTITLDTGHTDTLGILTVHLKHPSAMAVIQQFRVHARLPDDHAFPATTGRSLDVDTSGRVVLQAITHTGSVLPSVTTVTGNVNGSVASVTGAVGSVTGNVGGDVSGRLLGGGATAFVGVGARADVREWIGSAPNVLVSGRVDTSTGAMAANVLTATAINAAAITSAKFAANAIDATAIAANAITSAKIAAAAITSTQAPNLDAAITTRSSHTASDVWGIAVPGAFGAGTAGNILGNRVDVAVSTRASPGAAMALTAAAVDDVWDEDIVAAHGTADTAGRCLRTLDAISDRANRSNLNALLGVPDDASVNAGTMVGAVWDEVLTGATHNITNSAGKRLRQAENVFARNAICQVGSTPTTIVLDAGASDVNDFYKPGLVSIVNGTGAGQFRRIASYNGGTKTATVATPWVVTPDATTEFSIQPWATVRVSEMDTDVIDAAAIKADAVTEIQAGLATAAALATVQADTDDIQARLPAVLVGGRIDASVGAMAAGVITASQAPNLDAAVSSRAAPGAAMTLTSGERTAIWETVITGNSDRTQAGGALNAVRQAHFNRIDASETASGTLTLYQDGGVTPLVSFTLRDKDGNAIALAGGASARRGQAA